MIKLATVFSGIGAIEWALKRMNLEHEIVFACDNGERDLDINTNELFAYIENKSNKERKIIIDNLYDKTKKNNYVQDSYMANYNLNKENFYQDVRFINGKEYYNEIDLFVGGSPCQSFSIIGKRGGLDDARGTLFYDYARLIKEIKPKVFIYENVPGMLSHDKGNTFNIISDVFDRLGYKWRMKKLNSKDFGIPQNRNRLFFVGFRDDLNITNFSFPIKQTLDTNLFDYLDDEVESKYYHSEKGFKWVTNPKNLKKRVSINSKIARTQAANQQFNWCGDMIFRALDEVPWAINDKKIYIGDFNKVTGVVRKLTPRECLRLMGFDDNFKIVVSDTQMYRQAGNSIVVNVLEAIVEEIIKTGVFS